MADSPASASSLELFPVSANEEEIPSGSAIPDPITTAESSNPALALIDE
jgi:hypothetical protein